MAGAATTTIFVYNVCNFVATKIVGEAASANNSDRRNHVSQFGVILCEPICPSGKAGKQKDIGSISPRLSFLFKSCALWTLS